jgi:hypothetical protein
MATQSNNRVNLTLNPNYKRSGIKSYAYALEKCKCSMSKLSNFAKVDQL